MLKRNGRDKRYQVSFFRRSIECVKTKDTMFCFRVRIKSQSEYTIGLIFLFIIFHCVNSFDDSIFANYLSNINISDIKKKKCKEPAEKYTVKKATCVFNSKDDSVLANCSEITVLYLIQETSCIPFLSKPRPDMRRSSF